MYFILENKKLTSATCVFNKAHEKFLVFPQKNKEDHLKC